jgi:hypothetical protein
LEINSKYFVYEHLYKVWLNFAILFGKNAIFRKGTSAHFDAKLWKMTPCFLHIFSSPELKAQMSFSDCPASVCLSVRL